MASREEMEPDDGYKFDSAMLPSSQVKKLGSKDDPG